MTGHKTVTVRLHPNDNVITAMDRAFAQHRSLESSRVIAIWRIAGGTLGAASGLVWLRAAGVVLALNAIFALFLLWQATLPAAPLGNRIEQAFALAELTEEDWRGLDFRRGTNQYNDCVILQLMINNDDIMSKAFAPVLYVKDLSMDFKPCATLFEIIRGSTELDSYIRWHYTRYWHGYVPLAAALLQVFDLSEIRQGLKLTVYGALVLLVLSAGTQHRGLLAVAASIAVTGILFWALPYYGQSLSHGPGDAFVIFGIVGLLLWRKPLSRAEVFIPYCAAYGAGIVYLEFLTGPLPTAAGLLFPIAYLIHMERPGGRTHLLQGWTFAMTGLAVFASAGLLTVVVKQGLALIFTDTDSMAAFAGHLPYYTSMVNDELGAGARAHLIKYIGLSESFLSHPIVSFAMPFAKLFTYVSVLTYGSKLGGVLLCAATALAWIMACFVAVRKKGRMLSDFFAFGAGAGIIMAWIMLFQTHTFIHSGFMVRIVMVPISLGWAALTWQLLTPSDEGRSGSPVEDPSRWGRESHV